MEKKSRFSALFGSLSPEQRAALEKVQSALQDDPTCLDRRTVEQQREKEKKDAL